ncbi:MAG: MerR family transcriptional regulator [Caldithrix sp.]|nr:MerR family transcriptional regulator [Caldithrix sp.]
MIDGLLNAYKDDVLMPIGMVSKLFGISVATLRLYETEGLIIPHKSKGKHRQYSKSDIKRIACIRKMIEENGLNLAGIRLMLSAIPCWELKPCTEADRHTCDAYDNSQVPCWLVENKGDRCKNEDCRQCPVYLQTSGCTNIKSILRTYWRTKSDVSTVKTS